MLPNRSLAQLDYECDPILRDHALKDCVVINKSTNIRVLVLPGFGFVSDFVIRISDLTVKPRLRPAGSFVDSWVGR